MLERSVLVFAAVILSSQTALAQFSQQGPKLASTEATGVAHQGQSVALSADGNTAIVGGPLANCVDPARTEAGRHGGDWGGGHPRRTRRADRRWRYGHCGRA